MTTRVNHGRIRTSFLRDIVASPPQQSGTQPFNSQTGAASAADPATIGAMQIVTQSLTADKYFQVRNVIQIPFDDSVDATHPLECFFQMPTGVVTIKSIKVWVQQKSFRQYVSASSSAGTSAANSPIHRHPLLAPGSNATDTTTWTMADHSHGDPQGGVTAGANPIISNTYNSHNHVYNAYANITQYEEGLAGHTHTITTTVATTLTPGIYETAATGNFSVDTSNDGTSASYVNRVASQVPPITAVDVSAGFTTTAGDRRVRINATGLSRAQVLVVMDLILQLGA